MTVRLYPVGALFDGAEGVGAALGRFQSLVFLNMILITALGR